MSFSCQGFAHQAHRSSFRRGILLYSEVEIADNGREYTLVTRIDRNGKLPIYHQVALGLQRRIARQEWKVGDKLPNELELADAYDVSRVTIRQALTELEKDDIVVRQRPSGTFVNKIPATLSPTVGVMVDITSSLREAGHDTEITTIGLDVIYDVPDETREFLGTTPGDGHVVIKRLITVDHSPFAWIQNILSLHRYPQLPERGLSNNSVRQTLFDLDGAITGSSDHWIQVAAATPEDVELLNVAHQSVIMKLDTAFVDQHHVPLVYMCTRLITDQMRLHLVPLRPENLLDPVGDNESLASTPQ